MSDDRADLREQWERAAAGWTETRPAMQRMAQPLSQWMVEAIRPQPGHVLLELAAGLGDTGLMAAERVQPGGRVIITDGAEAMVAAARSHAQEIGAANVEVRQMEAEWIDLPTAAVDGVLCRFAYMLLVDPEAALREARRVLKPGGRLALAVWDALERNPWMAVVRAGLEEIDRAPEFRPGQPGPFTLSASGALEELLEASGFDEIEVEALDLAHEAESLDAWWEQIVKSSPTLGVTVAGLTPAEHYSLRDAVDAGYAPYVRDDGSIRIPARALAAAATA